MKALILAGGLGTRLRPLTHTRPKHLLPIAGRPHIEHVLDLLVDHGISDVVLTTSYLAHAFAETRRTAAARGINVEIAHEPEPRGTAGAIKNAAPLVADGTFLVFNGDVLTDVDLHALIAFHRDREAAATILLTPVEDPSAYGIVPTDGRGRVTRFVEKPSPAEATTNMINAGVYVVEPDVLDRIPPDVAVSIERETFPKSVEREDVFAWGSDAYWIDIGTPQKYLAANLDALAGRIRIDASDPVTEGILIGSGASISDAARVSSSCIGSDCIIENGATVRECVLLPRASVGSRAELVGCILGEGARVRAGASLTGVTLGDGETRGD
ncbi:MAG: NDP-sugar synthase [Actinomycetota bacterium]|nr:NDP-sugar synthase [Actinomycetota bacterium]